MKGILLTVFLSLGGVGLLFTCAIKLLPDLTYKGIVYLFNKFPKFRAFVHDNLDRINEFEKAEIDAINKAESEA